MIGALRQWWSQRSVRERRTVFVATAVVGSAVLAFRVMPAAVRQVDALGRRSQATHQMLAQAEALIAAESLMRDSLRERTTRFIALAPRLFGGGTLAEASAEFASFVRGTADARRVHIVRQDSRHDSATAPFARISAILEAEGDLRGLTTWIADLEGAARLITVTSLQLESPDPTAAAGQMERLRLTMTVSALAALQETPVQ